MRAATRRDFCNEDFVINMEVEAEEDTQNRVCEDCGETVSKKSWKRHQLRKSCSPFNDIKTTIESVLVLILHSFHAFNFLV